MAVFAGRHLGLQLFALAIAALLWLLISGQQIVERALRIPLEYTNLPPTLEMTGDTPAVVDVRVRGSSAALSRIGPGELVAVLDLRSARTGRRLFHLTGTDVRRPFGLEITQVTPSNVPVSFETSATKTVPVVPSVEGDPAPGFEVRTVTATPSTVEVVGPAGALKNLIEAMTEPVSVDGATASIQESVNVGLSDQTVRLKSPQSTVVVVDIGPALVDRTVSHVAVGTRGSRAARSHARPPQVSVAVRGIHTSVDGLVPDGLEAFVDVDGLSPGRYRLPVQVVAPATVTIVKVDPERVQVDVR